LDEFLQKRQGKSCPASRQASIDEIISDAALKEVFNTASSYGEIDMPLMREICKSFDDAGFMPYFRTHSFDGVESEPKEAVFDTASTFTDAELEVFRQRILEVAHDGEQLQQEPARSASEAQHFSLMEHLCPTEDDMFHGGTVFEAAKLEEAMLDDQHLSAEDRLRGLRMRGSAIQQKIAQTNMHDQIPYGSMSSAPWLEVPPQLPSNAAVALDQMQQQQFFQQQLFTPRPNETPAVDAAMVPEMSSRGHSAMPPPPPSAAPEAPAVIRLSEAIAPPELGSAQLPSIGSLLHHKGGCRPCTFFHTRGCQNGEDCQFCHLCGPGEKKKRLRALKHAQREATMVALENAKATLASYRAAEVGMPNMEVDMIVE